jgi:hypothetical protein
MMKKVLERFCLENIRINFKELPDGGGKEPLFP